ncbi:hypothetical protein FACS1894111_00510 [Clostridia bacterium]|nr:hypothetical protein FACS1894111_00510 [Clostridia bacterium]
MKNMKKTIISYGIGGFGNDIFFWTLSQYFIMFITSQLFNTGDSAVDGKYIAWITALIGVLRIVELLIDPLIGGTIDATKTKIGKFKPWILGGGTIGSVCMAFLFTDIFGLASGKPFLYLAIFAVVYILMDIVYSFKDIAFWGMMPALSMESRQREKIATGARIGSTLGQAAVAISVIPLVKMFSKTSGVGDAIGDKQGWFIFGLIIAVVALITSIIVAFGTTEQDSLVRSSGEKSSIKDVFKIIAKNDKLLWLCVFYGLFALAYTLTSSFVLYYFTYVLDKADMFPIIGVIQMVVGFVSVALFPVLTQLIGRRKLFYCLASCMIAGIVLFFFAGTSVPLTFAAYVLFFAPYPMCFLVTLMTISDIVEYGQWKLGTRNEGVTLSVRPLLDKLAGAISNIVVGQAAVICAMTTGATAVSVATNPSNITNFKIFMFVVPLILLLISLFVFIKRVTLDEKAHDQIMADLEARYAGKKNN